MPDILIRGMEMPHDCFECKISRLEPTGLRCNFSHYGTKLDGRAQDCPLLELPPHGDLIDRDWLKGMAYSKVEDFGGAFIDTIDLAIAPVIVPSNKEETDG